MENEKQYAGFWIRVLAFFFDAIIIYSVYFGAVFLISIAQNVSFGDILSGKNIAGSLMSFVISFSFSVYVGIILVKNKGYTPGKKICKLRVVREDARPLTYGTVLLRETLGKIVSYLPINIGFLIVAFHPEKKRVARYYGKNTRRIRTFRVVVAMCDFSVWKRT